jgi:hypothetical protein
VQNFEFKKLTDPMPNLEGIERKKFENLNQYSKNKSK